MKYSKGEFLLVPNKSHLKGLDPAVQVLFIWLSEHSDDDNKSFPSRQTLAAECGVSVRTLDRAMIKLINLGMVKKSAQFNGNEQTTNLYRVVIRAGGGDKLTRGGDKSALGGDKNDTQNSPHLTHPIEDFDTKVSKGDKSPLTFENEKISGLIQYWEEATGLPIKHKAQRNRQACYRLLMAHGEVEVRRLIQTAAQTQGEKFAPAVVDFISLGDKLNALKVWEKRQTSPAPAVDPLLARRLMYPEKYGKVAA